jgi:hypothetical protein
MTTKRPIAFQQGRTDVVTAVLVPIDGVTRLPVRSGVDAQLWDPVGQAALPNRLVRNLSGQLVLVNEPADQELTFRLDPARAGYRGPLYVTFTPSDDGVSRVVTLERRPDSAFDETTTLVRGSVVRSAGTATTAEPAPVPGLPVREVEVPLDQGRTHVFASAIDLDRDDRPPFTHEARP